MEQSKGNGGMIDTERLGLVSAKVEYFEAALESHLKLAELLRVVLAKDWLVFAEGLSGGYEMLKSNPANLSWGTHFFIHKNDCKLIGIGGYCGAADENGMVEIGYAISPEYRGQGLATEAAKGLIKNAFSSPGIRMVDAHTLAELNESTRVLQKCGLKKIGEIKNTDEGDLWHWRLTREDRD